MTTRCSTSIQDLMVKIVDPTLECGICFQVQHQYKLSPVIVPSQNLGKVPKSMSETSK